VLTRWWRR